MLIITAIALTGCGNINTKPANSNSLNQAAWIKHKSSLSSIQKWQINGRFSAKTDTDNWTGSIDWRQNQERYEISINGPLGIGSIMLEGDDKFAQLRLSQSQSASDTNPQKLLYAHTGLKLPINELKYWLLGLPFPQTPNNTNDNIIELNEKGQLSKLNQNDWEVTFKRYTSQDKLQLPNKIFLVNHKVNVRLIIQTWQVYS